MVKKNSRAAALQWPLSLHLLQSNLSWCVFLIHCNATFSLFVFAGRRYFLLITHRVSSLCPTLSKTLKKCEGHFHIPNISLFWSNIPNIFLHSIFPWWRNLKPLQPFYFNYLSKPVAEWLDPTSNIWSQNVVLFLSSFFCIFFFRLFLNRSFWFLFLSNLSLSPYLDTALLLCNFFLLKKFMILNGWFYLKIVDTKVSKYMICLANSISMILEHQIWVPARFMICKYIPC